MIWIEAAHHWVGREGQVPRYIVIHGTAGFTTAEEVGYFFANPTTQASTHYVVGRDGTIVQCVSESDAAWANGAITGVSGTSGDGYGNGQHDWWWDNGINPNLTTIAIEHVKPHTDNSDLLTDAQAAASLQLVTDICQRWNIPQRKADQSGGITGHYALDPINRQFCPGPFPWAAIYNGGTMSIELSTPGVGNYFEGSPTFWHCKHPAFNHVIGGGMLGFYKTFGPGLCGLTNLGLPTTDEIGLGNGRTYQRFERGVLCWDPEHTHDSPPGAGQVYMMHIDMGEGQDPRITPLESSINDLKTQLSDERETVSTLSTNVADLTEELAAAQSKIVDLEAQIASGTPPNGEVEQLKQELADALADVSDLETRMRQIAVLAA